MAIAFDAATSVAGAGVQSLETAAFTISGSDRFAIVIAGTSAFTVGVADDIRIGGASGTQCTLDSNNAVYTSHGFISLGTLVAPSTGSQTAWAHWVFGTSPDESAVAVATYTGVDQTTPKGTVATNSAAFESTPIDPTVNANCDVSTSVDDVVIGVISTFHENNGGTSIAGGTGMTERADQETQNVGAVGILEEIATGGTTGMNWDINWFDTNARAAWAISAFKLNAVGGGGAGGVPVAWLTAA